MYSVERLKTMSELQKRIQKEGNIKDPAHAEEIARRWMKSKL